MTDDLHTRFRALSDEQWRGVVLRSLRSGVVDGVQLPGFPPDSEQALFTSRSREAGINEAFAFHACVKRACVKARRPLTRETRLLDFGVGWGRISRVFLKDVRGANLVGVDINEHILRVCQQLMTEGTYLLCKQGEPLPFEAGRFDLVTAFSVFSHLSPSAHRASLTELHRVLAPGGLVTVTTLSCSFVKVCRTAAENPSLSAFHRDLSRLVTAAFPDWRKRLKKWDDREMLYLPSGGGLQGLEPEHYGWAMVPRRAFESLWRDQFEVLDYVDDPKVLEQAVVTLRKR